jgi:hypothetical protein
MGCTPKFEASIPIECVVDAVQNIRSGQITIETAKKVLWAIGCVLEKVKPSNPSSPVTPIASEPTDPTELTELTDELKRALSIPSFSSSPEGLQGAGVSPEVWMMILELILKLLKK